MNGIATIISGNDFTRPDNVISITVCDLTGYLATPRCPRTRDEIFVSGTEPKESCKFHLSGQPIHEFQTPDYKTIEGF
jgi:membrane carboxypeptidase/penicillin-binding protein